MADLSWMTPALLKRARQLGGGREVIRKELGLTQHQSRQVVQALDNQILSGQPQTLGELARKVKYLEAENKQLADERSFGLKIAEAFGQAARDLPEVEIKRIHRNVNSKLDEEDVVLVISDVQLGQNVSQKHTGGLGSYGYDVFLQRLDRYMNAIESILKYHPNKLGCCHVWMIGDIIEGSTIFRGQQRQLDLVTVHQVTKAYHHFSNLIARVAGLFPKVNVITIPGNHARIGQKGENAPHDNLDWLLGYFIEERFRLSNVKHVRFHAPETWWAITKVRNSHFLLAHGDEFKSWAGIPYYGAERFKGRMRELLKETDAPDFDYAVVGHHHSIAEIPGLFMNGNWVGGSEFSLKTMQMGGLPYQWILGVHDNIGVSWSRKIILADKKRKARVEVF